MKRTKFKLRLNSTRQEPRGENVPSNSPEKARASKRSFEEKEQDPSKRCKTTQDADDVEAFKMRIQDQYESFIARMEYQKSVQQSIRQPVQRGADTEMASLFGGGLQLGTGQPLLPPRLPTILPENPTLKDLQDSRAQTEAFVERMRGGNSGQRSATATEAPSVLGAIKEESSLPSLEEGEVRQKIAVLKIE